VGHRLRPALPARIPSERFRVNTSTHLFSLQALNTLMRENWKDMLFVFAVTAFSFAVNYYALNYRAAQKSAAEIQERGK
jgi:hypothetical protein